VSAPGPVVLLNGAPRAGKTSIARALAATDERTWAALGVETARATTPAALQPGLGLRPGGERPDIEAALPGLLATLADEIAERSRAGDAVVVDLGLHEGHARPLGLWAIVAERLAGLPVWVVGVRCPLDEVVRRRRASGEGYESVGPDGAPTAAVLRWQDAVHRPGSYDLEVDTSVLTPEQAAERILAAIRDHPSTALAALATGVTS
jgi:chloramphenicol 3-O phosphotransferase